MVITTTVFSHQQVRDVTSRVMSILDDEVGPIAAVIVTEHTAGVTAENTQVREIELSLMDKMDIFIKPKPKPVPVSVCC